MKAVGGREEINKEGAQKRHEGGGKKAVGEKKIDRFLGFGVVLSCAPGAIGWLNETEVRRTSTK